MREVAASQEEMLEMCFRHGLLRRGRAGGISIRFRTWEAFGQLLAVTSQHGRDRLGVFLEGGHVCAKLVLHPAPEVQLCLAHAHLSDGVWHSVRVERFGQWVELVVDEGDGPLYNTTPTPDTLGGWSVPLQLDRQEGVLVGGSPEYVGVSLFTVHHDFHEGCLDDLRVSGVPLPLPPLANSTTWAQATMFTHVHPSCTAPAACTNLTCPEPLSCLDVWRRHECGSQSESLSGYAIWPEDVTVCPSSIFLYNQDYVREFLKKNSSRVFVSGSHRELPRGRRTQKAEPPRTGVSVPEGTFKSLLRKNRRTR
nr:putative neural-cadherin 2 [Penaeus vannamei]